MIQLNEYLINKTTKAKLTKIDLVKKYLGIDDPQDLKMMEDAMQYNVDLTNIFKAYERDYKKETKEDYLFNTEAWIIPLYPIALMAVCGDTKNAMNIDFFSLGYKGFKYDGVVENPYDGAWHECFNNGDDSATVGGKTFDTPLGMVQDVLQYSKDGNGRIFKEACEYYKMFTKYPKSWEGKSWFEFYEHY